MEQKDIDRINALARLAKERALTQEEQAERAALRSAYIASVKASLEGHLEQTYLVEEDGTKTKLTRKD